MSYAYGDPRSTRNHFREPQHIGHDIVAGVRKAADTCAAIMSEDYLRRRRGRPYSEEAKRKGWFRQLFTVVLLLQVLWIWALYYGERLIFSKSIEACDWHHWESWPRGANPHHVAFVADPQLVDPHTYPGRPWPLSTLTVKYTDLYLKRVYKLMQERLYPDTTIFLGDLFDGGREWSVSGGGRWNNPEKNWKAYGESFWLNEYNRFGKIFFDTFTKAGVAPRKGQRDRRRLIASLPGNHDLGFGNGVHLPVRKRFEAYFGEGNRVDIIGNHSFISVDGVSLSAKDHPDEKDAEQVWKPTEEFLSTIQDTRMKAIAEDLRKQFGVSFKGRYKHEIYETRELKKAYLPVNEGLDSSGYPAVLLSHVPLYRDPDTPCGPKRERYPQGRDARGKLLEKDPRNSILVQAGYQYQNVLSGERTLEITSQIGDVRYAFSGDDHDYCETKHMRFPSGGGGIREITVKTLSWAMGVRRPGVQLVTLWNPVDEEGLSIEGPIDIPTLQSHLCLLPDQLSIFIKYGLLFLFTVSVLLIRAAHMSLNPSKSPFGGAESPVLPTINAPEYVPEAEEALTSSSDDGSGSGSRHGRRSRAATLTGRSGSPAKPLSGIYGSPSPAKGYGVPLIQHAGYFGPAEFEKEKKSLSFVDTRPKKAKRLKGLALLYAEFKWTVLRVAFVAFPWYLWLLWSDG
ncbi:uncharacterized protein PV09_04966 [Verruconis gallopava]|uniref:Uncharacterized protein n=1 Tax=Verruconis gallopava TaxID=253628 RepID=A0A0D2AYC0_9PEZI|nr:uncharacterized protein PV09_04966 [Verruconis gallopava]KIW04159.1 hypothetical protein PV09_04966 [Verruconis gallopava]